MSNFTADYHFPTKLPYELAEVPKLFGIATVEQDPDPAMHFEVMVPLHWGQVKGVRHLVTPQHPFELRTHLKALTGPVAEARIIIAYEAQEVSPADWLSVYLENQEEKVLYEHNSEQEGGTQPDVLTISGPVGARRMSRWVVLKNGAKTGGAHLFLLQVSTTARDYTPEMAKVFFMAVSNFALLHPTASNYAEPLRTLEWAAPVHLVTAFPESWQQQENPLNDEYLYQVQLTKELDHLSIGRISLTVVAGQTVADMDRVEQETQAAYAEQDLLFKMDPFQDAPAFGGLTKVQMAVGQQTNGDGDLVQERHVLRGQAGSYWLYAESVYFTRATAPQQWAICKRAFDLVQKHLVITL